MSTKLNEIKSGARIYHQSDSHITEKCQYIFVVMVKNCKCDRYQNI